jgi:hypothetical protein
MRIWDRQQLLLVPRKLQVLRTDNGGEFTSIEFASYCVDEGI